MTDAFSSDENSGWGMTATADEAAAVADAPAEALTATVDEEPVLANDPEIVPLSFLETPAEAQEDGHALEAHQAFQAVARRHTDRLTLGAAPSTARRSARNSRSSPKPLSQRQIRLQKRAKLIIYGGIALAAFIVVGLASYKLPVVLFNYGKIEKPYIWPWGFMWEDWERGQQPDQETGVVRAGNREFPQKMINALRADAPMLLNEVERLYGEAVNHYDDGEVVQAVVAITKARQVLESIGNRLDEVRGLAMFAVHNKRCDRLTTDVGLKHAQWRKGLTFQQADEVTKALKKSGLTSDPPPANDQGGKTDTGTKNNAENSEW